MLNTPLSPFVLKFSVAVGNVACVARNFFLIFILTASLAWSADEAEQTYISLKNIGPLMLPANPTKQQPPSAIGIQIEKFFVAIHQEKVSQAFEDLLKNSEHVQRKYETGEFVKKTEQALSIYGKMQAYELYDSRKIGSRLLFLTYFVYLKSVPLRWRFVFYAPDGKEWKIINLSVDDLVDESILAQ